MFASFELRPDGLMHSVPPPRLARSHDGCMPCRRKRKKCDKTKPRCLRCKNSTNRDTCIWPAEKVAQRNSVELSGCDAATEASSSSSGEQEDDVEEIPSSPGELAQQETPGLPSLRWNNLDAISPWQLPSDVLKVSPDLSLTKLTQISLAFQRRILCHESEFAGSIFLLGLPGANVNGAFTHAWAACSIAATGPQTTAWRRRALLHHSYACNELRNGLRKAAGDYTNCEWMRATVLMLHLFETHRAQRYLEHVDSLQMAAAHLNASHRLFSERQSLTELSTLHGCMLYEAYVVRLVNNYFFQPKELPLDYVTKALDFHQQNLQRFGLPADLTTSPWVELWGRELSDIVYRLSWLAYRAPHGEEDLERIRVLARELRSHDSTESIAKGADPGTVVYSKRARTAYWHACSWLADVLLSGGLPLHASAFQRQHVREGLALIDALTLEDRVHSNLIWPLIVIGYGTKDAEELEQHRMVLQRLALSAGELAVSKATRMTQGIFEMKQTATEDIYLEDWMRKVLSYNVFL